MSTLSTAQDQVQDVLAAMRPRDRNLFIGLVLFVMVAVVAGSIWWMRGSIGDLEGRVSERADTLRRVELLAVDNAAAEAEFDALAKRLATHASVDVSSFLEKAADKVQIREKLDSVRKTTETDDGIIIESVYAIKLLRVDQPELAQFLAEVEGNDMPLRIRSFKVRLRKRKGETALDVDMDISAFKVSAGAEGSEG
jgi:hypothetical protein